MSPDLAADERLVYSVVGAFFEVYNTLGFGFLEHLYVLALERELHARGHSVGREVAVDVLYKGEVLGAQRLDLVVDGRLVVEAKSTRELHPAALRQAYNYLRATGLRTGLVLHFGPTPRFFRVSVRDAPATPTPTRRRRVVPTRTAELPGTTMRKMNHMRVIDSTARDDSHVIHASHCRSPQVFDLP